MRAHPRIIGLGIKDAQVVGRVVAAPAPCLEFPGDYKEFDSSMRCFGTPASNHPRPEFFELGEDDEISAAFDRLGTSADSFGQFAEYMDERHPWTPYAIRHINMDSAAASHEDCHGILIWNPSIDESTQYVGEPLYEIAHRQHEVMHAELKTIEALAQQRFMRVDIQAMKTFTAESSAEVLMITWNKLVPRDSVTVLVPKDSPDHLSREACIAFDLDRIVPVQQ